MSLIRGISFFLISFFYGINLLNTDRIFLANISSAGDMFVLVFGLGIIR